MSEYKLDSFDKIIIAAKKKKGQYVDPNADYSVQPGKLPSQHQIDDKVLVNFASLESKGVFSLFGKILAVHFFKSKVKYDIEIEVYNEPSTRIYNIDSAFVLERTK